jgi:hypothetical protein
MERKARSAIKSSTTDAKTCSAVDEQKSKYQPPSTPSVSDDGILPI